MRVHYVALLVAVVAASTDAALIRSTSGVMGAARPLDVGGNETPFKRLLRVHKNSRLDNDNNEERGISIGLVDDLVEGAKTTYSLHRWKSSKVKADDAIIKLNMKAADNVFASPKWQTWTRYMEMISTKENLEKDMVTALLRQYGVVRLSAMINKAKAVPGTAEVATKLEEALTKFWLSLSSNSPAEIFGALKLKEVDNIFDSPQFKTLENYLAAFNTKYPRKEQSLLTTFEEQYGGDVGVIKLLASPKYAHRAEAMKLKNDMVQSWLDYPTHPTNKFDELKLGDLGYGLLSSPVLSVWVQYMKAFNEKYPFAAKTSLIQQLTKSYGDEKLALILQAGKKVESTEIIAKNLQTAQFKQWMVEGKDPDYIYKSVLKLTSTKDENADVWRAYYNAYEKEFPGKLFSFDP